MVIAYACLHEISWAFQEQAFVVVAVPKASVARGQQAGIERILQADEQRFTIGYNIGEIARQIEPGGVLIGSDENRLLIMNEHKQLGTAAGSPSSHSMNARKRCFTRRSSTAC